MASAREKEDSVYDFLYVDIRRIGLLLSQFGQDGIPTELTRSTDATSEVGGGFDVKLAKLDQKEAAKKTLVRRFDPQWLIPLRFLDLANEKIVRDIAKATIGQFVLVSGSLTVLDLATLKVAWKSPAIRKLIIDGALKAGEPSTPTPQQSLTKAQRTAIKKEAAELKKSSESVVTMAVDVVASLPHVVQATLHSGANTTWCALREDGMIVSSGDILLKHGFALAGQWNVIGILDAQPDSATPEVQPGPHSPLGTMAAELAPLARGMLGRPETAYAVTPLLIMREVEGN